MVKRSLFLALVVAVSPLAAQRDFSGVEIKVTQVSGNIYMLEGAGGNIAASIGEDGIAIVDDQFAPLAPKIEAALKKISDKPIRFVLNTHWHGDHTGGNEQFGKTASIIAQTNVRKRLAEGSKIGETAYPPAPASAIPVITFDQSLSLHLNGEEIRAIHYPHGHTDGDSVIWFTKSNVVHLGDDFFAARFPFIDLDSGGSVRGLIANVKKIAETVKSDAKIIPGHGPLATLADLQAYLKMLQATSSAVERALKAGKNLDAMKEEKLLSAWDTFGKGFITTDRFLETLYIDLRSKKKK